MADDWAPVVAQANDWAPVAKPQAQPLTGAAYYRDANQKFLAQHPQASHPLTVANIARFAGNALTGAASVIPGLPGDLEQFANGGNGQFLPTSADIGNKIAGPPQSGQDAAARLAGGMFGPSAAGEIGNGIRALFAPSKIAASAMSGAADPQLASLAQRSAQLGIPIRPGQLSPTPFVRVADEQLSRVPLTGFSSDDPLKMSPEAQNEAFTRAISRTFGEDTTALTPDVLAKSQARIGSAMDAALARNTVALTPQLSDKLNALKRGATDALDEDAKPVTTKIDNIISRMNSNNGMLSGDQYKNWRQRGGLLSGLTESQNPTVAFYGQEVRNALDDAFQAQATGTDGQALTDARRQYRNLMTIAPLAGKSPSGKISPALVMGAVTKEFPNFATTPDAAGDLGDLARIGQAFLKSPPNSTTAERGVVMNAMRNPVKAAGELLGLPLSATVGRAMNAGINSPAYAEKLFGNAGQMASPVGNAGIGGILSSPMLSAMLARQAFAIPPVLFGQPSQK